MTVLKDTYSEQMRNIYDDNFYLMAQSGTESSAEAIVPIVNQLVQPKSVVDVGCGDGTWLSVFAQHGISDLTGIDGKWVNEKLLRISKERFLIRDLTKPLSLNRKFDLAVSLEVAEHLPSQCAEGFVNALAHLSSIVLFSAATPWQGGPHHVNEQWPSYWMKLFNKKGYVLVDAIRKRVWQNPNVMFYYAQNTLLYVDSVCLARYPLLERDYKETYPGQISVVHPELARALYLKCVDDKNMSLKRVLKASPYIFRNGVHALIRRVISI